MEICRLFMAFISDVCLDGNSTNPDEDQNPLQPPHSLLVSQVQGFVCSSIKSWKCQRSHPHRRPRSRMRRNISATLCKAGLDAAANISAAAVIVGVWRNDPETLMCFYCSEKNWLLWLSSGCQTCRWPLTYRQTQSIPKRNRITAASALHRRWREAANTSEMSCETRRLLRLHEMWSEDFHGLILTFKIQVVSARKQRRKKNSELLSWCTNICLTWQCFLYIHSFHTIV